MNILSIFGRKKRIIAAQVQRIEQLEAIVDDNNAEYEFLVEQFGEFQKQVGLRVGMNPGTTQENLFMRLDVVQRSVVVNNIAREILAGVDWTGEHGNPTQEEVVTASVAALEVLK